VIVRISGEGQFHKRGEPLAVDELVGSDVILPPADTTVEEAEAEFHGEGLIPS
jgi:hypothetical protein